VLNNGKLHLFSEIYGNFQFLENFPKKVGKSGGKWGKVGENGKIINLASELLRKRRNASDIKL
jgi:hypothetical protein